ncbi:uncharacterized protein LOC111640238 [Centruroides sculpturatus]|uniref:uncharacterized protein LOC111640238 n=1 Tax=Centruroides sculpturatus TaxID=218467 RepID=UPI000C6E86AF|nr:uncharacterized protein LOC111640238 [Centruroides sculpturatus]
MGGKSITIKKTLTYLGIILDYRLSWEPHIDHITKRTGLIFQAFTKVARGTWGLSFDALETIYNQLFIPIITYACGCWGWASNKTHPKCKLTSAQRKALIPLTKAYKTTSYLQVLARKPPIELHIQFYSQLSCLKWGNNIHLTRDTILTSEFESEPPFSLSPSPSIPHINIIYNTDYNGILIFTDGSKNGSNVGCSFVVLLNNNEIHHSTFRLGVYTTIFQAELFAILMALTWANTQYQSSYITIISDSASSLAVINSSQLHPLSIRIKNLIMTSSNKYSLMWTKAHHGLAGNERADALAKAAANNSQLEISYNKVSLTTVKRLLWREVLDIWQNKWNRE